MTQGISKTPAQEHETSITYDKSPHQASVGTNILADVRWMTKHWGAPAKVYEKPADGSTAWHIWYVDKDRVSLPRRAKTGHIKSEARIAAGKRLAALAAAKKEAKR